MKRFAKSIVLLLPLAGMIQSCTNDTAESKSMEQLHQENGLPVKVETLRTQPLSSTYTSFAVLTGIQESTAHAAVDDKVDQILHKVGDTVKKDDVVITFPTDNPAAQYTQAKVNVEHMRTTLARMKALYESGGTSRQEYDNVAAQCQVAEANWDAAQQAIQVRAPISGVLTRMDVQESDNVNPGDALFTVAKTGQLKAQLWVPENRIADVQVGNPAQAYWNGQTLTGRVSQADLSLNGEMQAFGVQVSFDNPDHRVLSGINAEVQILSQNATPVLVTARKNLVKVGETYYAYKLVDGKAVKQVVIPGRQVDLSVEIRDGLTEGDVILVEGLSLVENGQRVRVLN